MAGCKVRSEVASRLRLGILSSMSPVTVVPIVEFEVCNTAPLADRRYYYAAFIAVQQPGIRDAVGRTEALRKLVAHWFDTRTDPVEQSAAMNAAAALNVKELSATALALRVLAPADQPGGAKPAAAVPAYTKTQALGVLAKTGELVVQQRVADFLKVLYKYQ